MDEKDGVARVPIDEPRRCCSSTGCRRARRRVTATRPKGPHFYAYGESTGGRNLPAAGADRSSPSPLPAPGTGGGGLCSRDAGLDRNGRRHSEAWGWRVNRFTGWGVDLCRGMSFAKSGRRRAAVAALAAVLLAAPAAAQYAEAPPRAAAANVKPALLQNVGIDQQIGQQLPLDLRFTDDAGKNVRLGDYFGTKPVVLALAYYECPMLCTQVLNGMTSTLKQLSLNAATDFDVVVVSINPQESFRLAQNKKAIYVQDYGRPQTAAGWHFLTGTEPAIHALAGAIGFRYAYDENLQQYAHARRSTSPRQRGSSRVT